MFCVRLRSSLSPVIGSGFSGTVLLGRLSVSICLGFGSDLVSIDLYPALQSLWPDSLPRLHSVLPCEFSVHLVF